MDWRSARVCRKSARSRSKGGTGAAGTREARRAETEARHAAGTSPGKRTSTRWPAMVQKMGIDGPVEDGKAQPGNQNIFHLLPDLHGVDRFKFHVIFQKGKAAGLAAPQEAGAQPDKRGRAQFQREDAAAQDRGFGRPSREIQKPLREVPRDAGTGKSREARTSCRAQPGGDRRAKKQTFSDGGSAPKKKRTASRRSSQQFGAYTSLAVKSRDKLGTGGRALGSKRGEGHWQDGGAYIEGGRRASLLKADEGKPPRGCSRR